MAINKTAWITLVQTKTHLFGSTGTTGNTDNDSELELLINGVTDYIQKQCGGRSFLATTGDITEIQDGGNGSKTHLLLKNYPIQSDDITSIHYNNGNFETANWVEFQATSWTLYDTKGVIKVPAGIPGGSNNIRILYKGGYESASGTVYPMPQDLAILALNLVGKAFNRRNSQGKKIEEIGTAKVEYTFGDDVNSEDLKTIKSYTRINIV